MDDASFEVWSEALTALREERQKSFDQRIQDQGDSFPPADFYGIAKTSFEKILDRWFGYEQQAWEAKTPANPSEALDAIRTELESIFDFELDALNRDLELVRARVTWDESKLEEAKTGFDAQINELKQRFQLKVSGLGGGRKKPIVDASPAPQAAAGRSSGSSGGGLITIGMFFLGILLGAAPSVYFWDQTQQSEKKFQADRSQVLSEQRVLTEGVSLLHDTFNKLASGEIDNMPEIDKKIKAIHDDMAAKRAEVNTEFQKSREKLLKKHSAGDKLDKMLASLEKKRAERIASIKIQEEAASEGLLKQKQVLKSLSAR